MFNLFYFFTFQSLASKTCKTQLPILGIYPEESVFQKAFETILEQEKPDYIEKHGSQWIHIYLGRIEPLVTKFYLNIIFLFFKIYYFYFFSVVK